MFGKIIFIGLCVCLLGLFLGGNKSFVLAVEIGFACLAVGLILGEALETAENLRALFGYDDTVRDVFSCLMKASLVCIGTRFACDFCKESGNGFVGDIIDFSGRITLLVLCFPFVEGIIKAAMRFVK